MPAGLITCWQCVGSVAETAPWCPICGADLLNPRKQVKKRPGIFDWGPKVLVYLAGAVIIAFLIYEFMIDTEGSPAESALQTSDNGQLAAIDVNGTPATPGLLILDPENDGSATPVPATPINNDSNGEGEPPISPDDDGDGNGEMATPEPDKDGFLEVTGDSSDIAASSSGTAGEDGYIEGTTIQVIFDTSGSMEEELEGSTRMVIAKRVLGALVSEQLPAGTPLMMRTYGNEGNPCDTSLSMPLAPLDPAVMASEIDGLIANNDYTPLAESIKDATRDMKKIDGPKIVILLTDGLETCEGDPKAAVRSLVRQVPDVHLNIIGFGINDPEFEKEMAKWAKIGKGAYFDADDEVSLGTAVQAAVKPPFQVFDENGDEVASGIVGGDPIALPPGVYRVVFSLPGNPTIETVRVRALKTTSVDLTDAELEPGTPVPDDD